MSDDEEKGGAPGAGMTAKLSPRLKKFEDRLLKLASNPVRYLRIFVFKNSMEDLIEGDDCVYIYVLVNAVGFLCRWLLLQQLKSLQISWRNARKLRHM